MAIVYPGARSIFPAASIAFTPAVPSGSPSRLALTTTWRVRSCLAISDGEVERSAAELGAEPVAPWVDGRTGIRLAELARVARALLRVARERDA